MGLGGKVHHCIDLFLVEHITHEVRLTDIAL